jgi:lipoate-protein ligase A
MKIVLCSAIAFAAGYVFAKKQLEKTYMDIANDEIAMAEARYKQKWEKRGETVDSTEQEVKENWEKWSEVLDYDVEAGKEKIRTNTENAVTSATLSGDEDDIKEAVTALTSYATGVPQQTVIEAEPYTITVEEYLEAEKDFSQTTLTYYDGDGVLASEGDQVFTAEEKVLIIGRTTLEKFGEKSDDDNVVYIRNEKLQREFEIVRDLRKYSEVVLDLS